MPTRLLLDTDIGTDVDDAWALLLCLAAGEVQLAGVTLVYGDLDTRAKIALKMLHLADRTAVPVYKGLSRPLTDNTDIYWPGHEGTETDFSDITDLQAKDNAVDFILGTIDQHPGELTICSIGPLTNIAEAIRRRPDTMRRIAKLVIMASSYEGDGPEHAAKEHNSTADPVATRIVFESGIPATILGLNVTKRVMLSRSQLAELPDTPLNHYLLAMTNQYMDILGRDFTYMHDPLAAAAAIGPTLITTRRMRAEVLSDGRVAYYSDPNGWLQVCVDVDADRFHQTLQSYTNVVLPKLRAPD